jgi:hypothetical protein
MMNRLLRSGLVIWIDLMKNNECNVKKNYSYGHLYLYIFKMGEFEIGIDLDPVGEATFLWELLLTRPNPRQWIINIQFGDQKI